MRGGNGAQERSCARSSSKNSSATRWRGAVAGTSTRVLLRGLPRGRTGAIDAAGLESFDACCAADAFVFGRSRTIDSLRRPFSSTMTTISDPRVWPSPTSAEPFATLHWLAEESLAAATAAEATRHDA